MCIYIYNHEFLVSFTIRGILPLVELLFVGLYLYIRPVWFLVQAFPMPTENGIQFLVFPTKILFIYLSLNFFFNFKEIYILISLIQIIIKVCSLNNTNLSFPKSIRRCIRSIVSRIL